MSHVLRLIPLGGYGEIGKNMTVLECDEQLLLIDAGIAFPDDEATSFSDLLIPDFTFLRRNAERLAGIVLTHGHEDHIGGLPYLLQEIQAPLYGTRLTLGLVRTKLGQPQLAATEMHEVSSGDRVVLGPFDVECIRVNHSIPDCLGLGIRTPAGIVVHSGDFKFDHTPIDGLVTDFSALARLGDEGVRLLISDSTNIERVGQTPSEAVVGAAFERIFPTAPGRILIATFASQIHRIQQVFDVAAARGRKVLVTGRSMERNVNVAVELGYLEIPDDVRIGYHQLDLYPPEEVVVLITGVQGEPVSGLRRLGQGDHPKLRVHPDDTVILSATPIPGNEATVWRMINDLMRSGAHVVDHRHEAVHVSGHASSEEIKLLFNLIRPQYAVPFHGEYRHMIAYGELAQSVGLSHEDVFLLQNGDVLRLDDDGASLEPPVEHGVWTIEGRRINELGMRDATVQDRSFLSESGVITGAVAWDFAAGELVGPAQVAVRGVRLPPDDAEAEAVLAGAADQVHARLAALEGEARLDPVEVERAGKRALRSYFEKATRTYPVLQFLLVGLNQPPSQPEPETIEPAAEPRSRTVLQVDGEVERGLALTFDDLRDLVPAPELIDGQAAVELSAVLQAAGVNERANYLTIANERDGWYASVPIDAVAGQALLCFARDERALVEDEGGPVRLLRRPDAPWAELGLPAEVPGVNRLSPTVGPGRDSRPPGG